MHPSIASCHRSSFDLGYKFGNSSFKPRLPLTGMLPSTKSVPKGRAHKVKPKRLIPQRPSALTAEQQVIINNEIELLPELIKTNYVNWSNGAKSFQLDAMCAQLRGQDVMIHAATGSGKTGIAAAPHLLPSSKGKVTIVISPILALQDKQASALIFQ